jgi:multiple sugar transport system ATP-binding protein
MASIEMKNIVKEYGDGFAAVNDISIDVEDGEFMILVGPSGCGKSTLLRMIVGLEDITSGDMVIDGERVNEQAPRDRNLAMVFQNYALYPHLTVYENIAFPLRLSKEFSAEEIDTKVRNASATLELDEHLERKPGNLSGGQRQRVALARAIACGPDALVLDEPTSALDVSVQAMVLELLAGLQQRRSMSYLFITHDLAVVRVLAHRVVVLYRGRVIESGPTQAVFGSPLHRFTQMLISALPVVSRDEERLKPPWPWDREAGVGMAPPEQGCPFRPRCPYAVGPCAEIEPELLPLGPDHSVRCHNPGS